MIVSINGMDNSGKTTQIKELMKLYPDYYIKTLHIKNTKSFNQEKYDFDWWFNPNIKEDFVKVILESLSERNEIAKSLDHDDKVILFDKGNDFYETRILATLILKGETLESSLEMLQKIKSQYDLENIEQLKLFLLPGNYPKKENFNSVGAFNSLKDLTEEQDNNKETPQVQINIVDNSNLESALYEDK